jgi:TPP-dependent pyruvate/acetoin dehydrogenase alpha subunit
VVDRDVANDVLIGLYRTMQKIRQFEDRIYFLFLQGSMPGTIHLYQGQEAVAAGVCASLTKEDVMTSTHRPHGHAIAKGVPIKSMMAELFAKTSGCCKAKGGSMHVGDITVGAVPAIAIVAAGIPIAAGAALAFKMKRTDRVAACFFGDGGANEGAFHEGVNMAAIWSLPVVFVCENNLYGASTHVSKVVKVAQISQRAAAYGIPGVTVDGNNVVEVFSAAQQAVERARRGQGPTLIECMTYRLGGHSRRDACNYRPEGEKEEWAKRDPLLVMRAYLVEKGICDEAACDQIAQQVEREIEEAVQYAQAGPAPEPEAALEGVFA